MARTKRFFLNWHGRRMSRRQEGLGFPGNEWLGGITDPPWVKRADFFESWLESIPGRIVEMSCHPGNLDETLLGRDCQTREGMMQRRVDELERLRRPEFFQAVARAGFQLVNPAQLLESGVCDAACLIDGNHLLFVQEGVIPSGGTRTLVQTPPYDHCNFTVLDGTPAGAVARFRELLLAMSYGDARVRRLLDLEGLKRWLPGRTSGYGLLAEAVDKFGFLDEFVAAAR